MSCRLWLFVFFTACIVLAGCKTKDAPLKESTSTSQGTYSNKQGQRAKIFEPLSANQFQQAEIVAEANDRFAFRLAESLGLPASEKNHLISPLSASTLLAALLNGTTGAVHDGLRKALALDNMPISEINSGYQAMNHLMATDSGAFKIANSVWFVDPIKPNRGFVETTEDYYDAEVRKLGSRGLGAPAIINKWVHEKTDGRIDRIMDKLDPNGAVVLVNALCFTGKWFEPFEGSLTQKASFFAPGGESSAMMMRHSKDALGKKREFTYTETDLYQTLVLHYKNSGYSMAVVLPRKGKTLKELWRHLSHENWKKMIRRLDSREGKVALPKWKFTDALDLKESLVQLGAEAAFRPSTGFLPISYELEAAYIAQALQKTMIEVDEKGTKAAAATAIDAVPGDMSDTMKLKPFEFTADRPFLYAILGGPNRVIVFLGVCNRP